MTPKARAEKKPRLRVFPEEVKLDDPQKVQAEENDHKAGDQVDGGLMGLEEMAYRSGQGPHGHEDQREAQHKAQGGF